MRFRPRWLKTLLAALQLLGPIETNYRTDLAAILSILMGVVATSDEVELVHPRNLATAVTR